MAKIDVLKDLICRKDYGISTDNLGPFDMALLRNNTQQAGQLIAMPRDFLDQCPKKPLSWYIQQRPGNNAFSETLCLFLRNGIYEVEASFIHHILQELDISSVLRIIRSITLSGRPFRDEQQLIVHLAVSRMSFEIYTAVWQMLEPMNDQDATKKRCRIDAIDVMGQTPLFYFVHSKLEYSVTHL